MKSNLTFLTSHGMVAVVATAAAMAASSLTNSHQWVIVLIGSLVAAVVASTLLTGKLKKGVSQLQEMLKNRHQAVISCGIGELDNFGAVVLQTTKRFDEIEATSRQNAREVQAMLTRLSSRKGNDPLDFAELKNVLGGLGRSLNEMMSQVEKDVVELGRCTRDLKGVNQSEATYRVTALLQNLNSGIDQVQDRCQGSPAADFHQWKEDNGLS